MSKNKRSAVPQHFRPQIRGTECSWLLPKEFNENEGLAVLGFLQNFLSKSHVKNCFIDFHALEWADPHPLLNLGLVLAESKLSKDKIKLNLGSVDEEHSTPNHRIFLKFFSQQGFLAAYSDHVLFRCEGRIQEDIKELRSRLAIEPQATHFINADCILAKIVLTNRFQKDKPYLQKIVEEFLKEAKARSVKSSFALEPLSRDILFQKLRKLLYELLLNVSEHSHPIDNFSYAGVYARIRGPKPPVETDTLVWDNLFKKTQNIFGQRKFNPNPHAEWLELFISDVGIGLTKNIAEWKEPDDKEVANDLKEAKKHINPLESIAHRLFRNGLSRHHRHDADRTAVTGLQHLGHLLTIGNDYCRLYTQDGCWVGNHLPWQRSDHSRKDIRNPNPNPIANSRYSDLKPVSGTAYAFSIQPDHNNLSSDQASWILPNRNERNSILTELRNETIFRGPMKVEFYDRFNMNSCLPPSIKEFSESIPDIILVRPPRLFNKQDFSKWLDLLAGDSINKAQIPVRSFVIAGLTPFQSLTFRELLLNNHVNQETALNIYLVTENWAVSCISTLQNRKKFTLVKYKAQDFLAKRGINQMFGVSNLAVLLRQMDSIIFWEKESVFDRIPFFNKPVEWYTSQNKKKTIKLKRYLDFPIALTNHNRYQACLCSLKRSLSLYPGYNAIGADNLVSSIVRDAKLSSYTQKTISNNSNIVVGSIAVTAGTVSRAKRYSKEPSIQILCHDESDSKQDSSSVHALLWISQLQKTKKENADNKEKNTLPWRRIPNTPYIAPLGEQSISILRYKRLQDGSLDFETPLYGRTPEQTYNDFERLEILKIGHWKYINRHDLLTINMRLAFNYSFLELGSLYSWLKKQFDSLFSAKMVAEPCVKLIIYPSHPVTDMIFDHIRKDPNFKDCIPEGGMIPVKFLGMRTVSPLLASHLVADRIKKLIHTNAWDAWEAVVFDDGTITGKHMRELTQFLQGLGSYKVYTIAFLDRTGLPAHEAVFEKFNERHKRLWRWDMPALGNKRNCPLCRALSIVQIYAQKLPSERQKNRLKDWIELWKVRDVELEWYQGRQLKTSIMPPLKITFGVDEDSNKNRKEKQLSFNSSTAATSLLVELTRLTTRSDVAIKKAEEIKKKHCDAAIEIIASQLLLFIDELRTQEKVERYIELLSLIWEKPTVNNATSLAGLCLSLSDNNVLNGVWNFCKTELLAKVKIGNIDAILVTNIIRSKHDFETTKPYRLQDNASEIEQHNYIMLGGGIALRHIIRNFLTTLYRNPLKPDQISTHTTEIRKNLLKLFENDLHTDKQKMNVEMIEIIQNMRLIEQIILDLQNEFILKASDSVLQELNELVLELEAMQGIIFIKEGTALEDAIINIRKIGKDLHSLLYEKEGGLVINSGNQLFKQFKNSDEFDNDFIAKMVRVLKNKWDETLEAKEKSRKYEITLRRWRAGDSFKKPKIFCSENKHLTELWIYSDSFVKGVIEDTLLNVFHASESIEDPFIENSISGTSPKAHLWWHVEEKDEFAIFKTANVSVNQSIDLHQKVNIAGLERAGGNIRVKKPKRINKNIFIIFTEISIPLYSYFLKEKK